MCKAVLDESAECVRKEAVQTAVMAARVVIDGDGSVRAWRAEKGLDQIGPAAELPADTQRTQEESMPCDCEDYERGLVSNECAVHNLTPRPKPCEPSAELWRQEGVVLVPKEPTEAMVDAGASAACEYMERTGGNSPRVIYRAMIGAAPQPEEVPNAS